MSYQAGIDAGKASQKSLLKVRSDHGKGRNDMPFVFYQDSGDAWYAGLMFAILLVVKTALESCETGNRSNLSSQERDREGGHRRNRSPPSIQKAPREMATPPKVLCRKE